FREVHRKF
ncbi:unnamed protein product, partial [Allacma fusca]